MQNLIISSYVLFITFFHCIEEISMQAIVPIGYGSSPMTYSQNDDDLGILLTILLLAGRNKNCNEKYGQTCSRCNCCESSQSIPIPYPIPFPTNNPIINRRDDFYDDSDEDDEEDEEDEDDHDTHSTANGSPKDRKSIIIKPDHKGGDDKSVTIKEVKEEQESKKKIKDDSKPKNN